MKLPHRTWMKVAAPTLLALTLGVAACDGGSDTDQQIAELEQQVSDLEAELEQTQDELAAVWRRSPRTPRSPPAGPI
jgi:outer membrane protein TolC